MVVLMSSEWMAATPLTVCDAISARCAMRTHFAWPSPQGLTLDRFSAHLVPFIVTNSTHRPIVPHRIPQNVHALSRVVDECKPLPRPPR